MLVKMSSEVETNMVRLLHFTLLNDKLHIGHCMRQTAHYILHTSNSFILTAHYTV